MLSEKAYSAVALVKDTRQRHHTVTDNLHRHSLHCKTSHPREINDQIRHKQDKFSSLNRILKTQENLIC